jgi:UDP-sulfoquinovose synthase
MRVLIAGCDGYLGWPLAQHLAARGHIIGGIDNQLRRRLVTEAGGESAIPIASIGERLAAFQEHFGSTLAFFDGDVLDYSFLLAAIRDFQPDAIVHLAEIPSAPYSMKGPIEAAFTQQNNVIGSLNLIWAIRSAAPEAHLLKLGTMGEYGTPNIDIPEGFFEVEYGGRRDRLPFPRQAGSFYHWSKVHDSNNIMFACRVWGLRATDVMQGIVYGTYNHPGYDDPHLWTRFDYDAEFGTIINRFCCQAVMGHPLTVYGGGEQKRSYLPIGDSLDCLTLALEHPPTKGEYRVFNQFDQFSSMRELALLVQRAGTGLGLEFAIAHYENPRLEVENHYYNPARDHLTALGYQPRNNPLEIIKTMLEQLQPWKDRIAERQSILIPDIQWDGSRKTALELDLRGITS